MAFCVLLLRGRRRGGLEPQRGRGRVEQAVLDGLERAVDDRVDGVDDVVDQGLREVSGSLELRCCVQSNGLIAWTRIKEGAGRTYKWGVAEVFREQRVGRGV